MKICPVLSRPTLNVLPAAIPLNVWVGAAEVGIDGLPALPIPVCPLLPEPQAQSFPVVSNARLWLSPDAIVVNVCPVAMAEGMRMFPVTAPFPCCPCTSEPQDQRRPDVSKAILLLRPAEMAVNVCPAATIRGTRTVVVVPSPSCPALLYPQDHRRPDVSKARLWLAPAAIAVNGTGEPTSATGATATPPTPVISAPSSASVRQPVTDAGPSSRTVGPVFVA